MAFFEHVNLFCSMLMHSNPNVTECLLCPKLLCTVPSMMIALIPQVLCLDYNLLVCLVDLKIKCNSNKFLHQFLYCSEARKAAGANAVERTLSMSYLAQ